MLQEWLQEQQRWKQEKHDLEIKQTELVDRLASTESAHGESEDRHRRLLQTERDRRKEERARANELRGTLEAKLEEAEVQIRELTASKHTKDMSLPSKPALEPGLATPGIGKALGEQRIESLELELESLHADLESRSHYAHVMTSRVPFCMI